MRLEQVQAFLAVAETGSFQKAAQHCAVTQSTISRQIQRLEDAVGRALFHRTHQSKLMVAGLPVAPVLQRFCHEFPQVQLRLTALGSDRALNWRLFGG